MNTSIIFGITSFTLLNTSLMLIRLRSIEDNIIALRRDLNRINYKTSDSNSKQGISI